MRKLYIWPKRGFIAIAYAESLEEARKLCLEEINSEGSDGSFPAITRAVEAVKGHRPQIFAYTSTAEFSPTDSGIVESFEVAEKEIIRAAENLYAFAEAFGKDLLTDEGKRQVSEAYSILKKNGSKMFPPDWDKTEKGPTSTSAERLLKFIKS